MAKHRFTTLILLAMVLGVLVGYANHTIWRDTEAAARIAGHISLVSTLFLRLITMIIGPLVFTTLVSGVARMGDARTIGRIGGRAMLWFVSASMISLFLGMLMANLLQPGAQLGLHPPATHADIGVRSSLNVADFINHMAPKSAVGAFAQNEVLQIVVFSILFGVAAAACGERARGAVKLVEETAQIILKITGYVMNLAPIAVFASIAATVTEHGPGILLSYGRYLMSFYFSLGMLWLCMAFAGYLILGKVTRRLFLLLRAPFLIALSTASSEAAYPAMLRQLQRLPVSDKVASFVLPLGYSFNLDGSMMYATFATLFIAQAYGVDIPLTQQIIMLLVLMITSKGMAGVPRASLVVVAATLEMWHLPTAGLLLVIGVDQFLDMGRSATNVLGNGLAAAVVAKLEGEDVAAGEPEGAAADGEVPEFIPVLGSEAAGAQGA